MNGVAGRSERIRVAGARQITGLNERTLQAMAARGQIPGAGKLGGSWTFDEANLREWIREQEQAVLDRAAHAHRDRPAPTILMRDRLRLEEVIAAKLAKTKEAERKRR